MPIKNLPVTLIILAAISVSVLASVNITTFAQTTDEGMTYDESLRVVPQSTSTDIDPTTNEDSVETFRQRRAELVAIRTANLARYSAIRAEKLEKLEDLTARQLEERTVRPTVADLEDIKARRIEYIKQHLLLTSARYTKLIDLMYSHLERISAFIDSRKLEGFDVSDAEVKLAEIETKLEEAEVQVENFDANLVEDLNNASSIDEIQAIISEMKTESSNLKSLLSTIKQDIVSLVRQIR